MKNTIHSNWLSALIIVFVLVLLPAHNKQQDRPNILWITVEDMSPNLGSFGDMWAHTPNLDALAQRSVRYSHAFATAPVCAPARSSIITGMYQSSLGSHNMRSVAWLPSGVRTYPEYLKDAGYYVTNNSKTDYNFDHNREMWDESSSTAHWRNRKTVEQPFFSIFNFVTTHESRIAQDERYEEATSQLPDSLFHEGDQLPLPPYYPDTPGVRAQWERYYNIITAMDIQVGEVLNQLEADGLSENTIIFFYSDHGVGLPRGKRWLYDSGLHVPLMVFFPEKYKNLAPSAPGTVIDRLVSFIDFPATALSLAGIPPPEFMQGIPFLGAFAGEERSYIYAARDRMDERYDMIRAVKDRRFKYIRNYESYKPYFQYMNTPEKGRIMQELRAAEKGNNLPVSAQKYFASEKPAEELYDTLSDPHELNNLLGNPNYEVILERMRGAHRNWLAEINDVGLLPESFIHSLQSERQKSIYSIVREDTVILQEALAALINLSSNRSDMEIPLMEGLRSESPAARYWSAIGLGIGQPVSDNAIQALVTALEDAEASVRTGAAWALGVNHKPQEALEVLTHNLQHENGWVRLRAAIVLDEFDEMARTELPALQEAMNDTNRYVVRVVNKAINDLLGTNNVVP